MDSIFCEKCGTVVRMQDFALHLLAHVKEKTVKKKPAVHRCDECGKEYTSKVHFEIIIITIIFNVYTYFIFYHNISFILNRHLQF